MGRTACRLRVSDEMGAFVRGVHPKIKGKVRAGLREILTDPHGGKTLRDELDGLRGFGVGRFRIIYRIGSSKVVDLVAVGPRERIYEETFRIVKKEEKGS